MGRWNLPQPYQIDQGRLNPRMRLTSHSGFGLATFQAPYFNSISKVLQVAGGGAVDDSAGRILDFETISRVTTVWRPGRRLREAKVSIATMYF